MSALMGADRRVLITGSRNWDRPDEIATALADIARQWPLATLVSGACPTGADNMAEDWWRTYGGRIELHPADWERFGKVAGFRRNAEMVNAGADVCLAFIRDESKGASHTLALAKAARIPVQVYRWTATVAQHLEERST